MWNGGVRVDIASVSSNVSGAGATNGGAINSNAGSVKLYLECGSRALRSNICAGRVRRTWKWWKHERVTKWFAWRKVSSFLK